MSSLSPTRWQELQPLVDELLDLDESARAARLATIREVTPLDADALEALLATDVSAVLTTGAFVGTLAALTGHPSLAGQALGAWTLVRPLGRGGMGAVWLAERNDGRFAGRAAVKLLHPSLTEGANAQRFQREGEVLARLTHPNIARLYDAGVTPHGQPYLVLEYIEGERIDEWCRSRGAPVSTILGLIEQVLSAVAHAHARGVIHRDIKPSNLLVTADGSVKLLDFGIAQLGQAAGIDSGAQPFTPRYAAPEQLRQESVTTATDVFAIGVVLHELLSGRHPSETPSGGRGITEHAPPSVSAAPIPRHVPRDVTAIVRFAIADNPDARYQTATAMADDLDRWRRHAPVRARNGGWMYHAGRFVRRHRAAVAAGTVVSLAVVAAMLISTAQAGEAARQRDGARESELQARVTGEVLAAVVMRRGRPDSLTRIRETLQLIQSLVEPASGGNPRLAGRVYLDLADLVASLEQFAESDSLLRRAKRLGEAAGDAGLAITAACRASELQVGVTTDFHRALSRETIAAFAAMQRAEGLPWTARAACYNARALALINEFRVDSAVRLARAARALATENGDSASSTFRKSLQVEASALYWGRRLPEAVPVYRARLDALHRAGLGQSALLLTAGVELLAVYVNLGELVRADSLKRALLARPGVRAALDDAPITTAVTLGGADLANARYESGLAFLDRALAQIDDRTHAPVTIRVLVERGKLLVMLGRLAEAREMLRRAQAVRTPTFDPAPLALEGHVLRAEGKWRVALGKWEAALTQHGYPDRLRMIDSHVYLRQYIELLITGERWADALRAAQMMVRADRTSASSYRTSAWIGGDLLRRGVIRWRLGDTLGGRITADSGLGPLLAGSGPDHPVLARWDSAYRAVFGAAPKWPAPVRLDQASRSPVRSID